MEPQSKENILTKTDLTDDERIYTLMKKSMKEMKSNITTEDKDKDKEKEESRTYYGIETGTEMPNFKEEDQEIEMDGKEVTAIQDQNPREDTEIIEIAVKTGEGIVAGTGATDLLGDMEEITNTETETEKIERTKIIEMRIETKKEEKMTM